MVGSSLETQQEARSLVLAGLRVVELGRGLAAPVAGMVLAEQGAEVVRVVDPARPPLDPVLDALLARGKGELQLELGRPEAREQLRRLVARADVLLDDLPPGALAGLGLDPEGLRTGPNPGLISCSIPAFAPGDPREGLPDYEVIVAALGYLFEKPIGAPQVHDFPLGSVLAALFASNAVMAALIARPRTGRGQHVSAARVHADIFAQVVLVLMNTGIPRGFLPLKMVGTPFMGSWKCHDGRYIYLHISLPAHNARILEILEEHGYRDEVQELRGILSEETMRDPSQVKSIPEAKAIKAVYERIFLTRPAMEWEQVLGGELCCIAVRSVEEWIPASIEAGMADAGSVDDPVFGELLVPGASVTVEEHPPRIAPRAAVEAGPLLARWEAEAGVHGPVPGRPLEPGLHHPLQGLRVADLSRVIAGPCAARILAELGAEVLSIQQPTRLDWALTFHLLFNAGKTSCNVDFSDDEGKRKLWALLEHFQPHAFIQNYRHLDLARTIGVGPEQVRAHFPNIAYTHLNAYGNLGIWRDRPGFEQVVQAVSGIQMTYGRGGKPKLLPSPVIDIGSGLLGAFATQLGLYQQQRTGESLLCTTHLTRTAVLFQILPVAAFQRARCLERAPEAVYDPQAQVISGIVRARDAFCCIAGPRRDVVRWLEATGLGSAREGNPLEQVSRKVLARSVKHWQSTVEKAGLAPNVVIVPVPSIRKMIEELPKVDPGPVLPIARRDYAGVDQQLTFIRNPIRMSATPTVEVATAPMRGQHTAEVLARIDAEAPEDSVVPYPAAKPLHIWAATLVRWGYFAWRSGNI
ncbi:MAG: CoA transferase [Pseudomonadota bacterium]